MELKEHNKYMNRCLQLAEMGKVDVAPNPMVGAVLVYEERIIGEGYHRKYGEAHAEVQCLLSVEKENLPFIQQSTLYVSLEPCVHFGKTPPCADLIIQNKIPEVVIGCRDPFVKVSGKGIEKLEKAGIRVIQGIMEQECMQLNKRFFTFHTRNRPYITLKWAQTLDGKIGNDDHSRIMISNEYSNRLVHKWRSEEMAIMVGTNTALFDDPQLNTRLWPGPDPVRLVLDLNLRLPRSLKIFSPGQTTIIFNLYQHTLGVGSTVKELEGVAFYQVTGDVNIVHQVLNALYQLKINSVLIEGGAQLLQSFIDEGAWDEARVITNERPAANPGLAAPVLYNQELVDMESFSNDVVQRFKRKKIY